MQMVFPSLGQRFSSVTTQRASAKDNMKFRDGFCLNPNRVLLVFQ
jgi:hypothetical protein